MKRIGKFEIIEELGKGGMGAVYHAHDTVLGREVALKVILEDVLDIPEIKDRFRREAKALAQIDHENVTTLYEFGYEGGQPFMAMQFLQGEDLKTILDEIATGTRKPLPLAQKLDYALQICKGLHVAHSKNIVHRDIKPANIRVLSRDRVKIMDFGIAKPTQGTVITGSGQQLGTPSYMSPEQVRGTTDIDKRSDIFSFGVLLYEMLTSERPFSGGDIYELMNSIINSEPQQISIDEKQFESELQTVISKCLQKQPEKRYRDFSHVIAELAPICDHVRAGVVLADSGRTLTVAGRTLPLGGKSPGHVTLFGKWRFKTSRAVAMAGGLIATVALAILLLPRLADLSPGSATPRELAAEARGELAAITTVAEKFGTQFTNTDRYEPVVAMAQQGEQQFAAENFQQARVSFKTAQESLQVALKDFEQGLNNLRDKVNEAKNQMILAKAAAQAEGAEANANGLFHQASQLEARADSSLALNTLSGLRAANQNYADARSKYAEAKEQAIPFSKLEDRERSALSRLRLQVVSARDDMLSARLAVPGSQSDRETDSDFKEALAAENEAERLKREGKLENSLRAYQQANKYYRAATTSVLKSLQKKADAARKTMLAAKGKIPVRYADEKSYQQASQAEKEAGKAYEQGDFVKAASSYQSASTSLNSLNADLMRRETNKMQQQMALEQAIRDLRKQYSKSLESGDLDLLRSLHKNFTSEEEEKWARVFGFTKDRQVTIAEDSKRIQDGSAVLELLIKIKYKDNKNRSQELNYAYTWTLEQIGGRWVIAEFKEKM
ncbi:MAG: protein kinase [bacterium]